MTSHPTMNTETAAPAAKAPRASRKGKPFNGHPSWNAWNVSLWLNNDEGLYRFARECIADASTKEEAARRMLRALVCGGRKQTPDGAPYTVTNIRRAMVGL